MGTDVRRGIMTREEFLKNAILSYSPVVLGITKRKQVSLNLDRVTYKTIDIEKESVRAEILTREATERRHIKARQGKRGFNAYAMGAKFIHSLADGIEDLQNLHNEVLREFSMQFDRLGLGGAEGNDGLLNSANPYYKTQPAHEIKKPAVGVSAFSRINELKKQLIKLRVLVNSTTAADNLVIYYYGDKLIEFLGEAIEATGADFFETAKKAFTGKNVTWKEIPSAVLPADAGNGFVVAADGLVTLDFTIVPSITNDGVNDEDNYYYANYAYGSLQVSPDVEGALIKLPITFEA